MQRARSSQTPVHAHAVPNILLRPARRRRGVEAEVRVCLRKTWSWLSLLGIYRKPHTRSVATPGRLGHQHAGMRPVLQGRQGGCWIRSDGRIRPTVHVEMIYEMLQPSLTTDFRAAELGACFRDEKVPLRPFLASAKVSDLSLVLDPSLSDSSSAK